MRYLLIATLLFTTARVFADEFTAEAAKAAKAAYEADLKAAREKYAAALDEAAKQAVEVGELDEVVRIKGEKEELAGARTADALTLARVQQALEGTKWTWTSLLSGKNKTGLSLLPEQKTELGGVNIGAWQMVEPRILIMRVNEGVWFLQFNEDYTEYVKVLNFKPSKHNITPGHRTIPGRSVKLID
jgi:hypothetical protein